MARLTGGNKQVAVGTTLTLSAVGRAIVGVREIGDQQRLKDWRKWTAEDVLKQVEGVPKGGEKTTLAYIKANLPGLKETAPKAIGTTPAEYIVGSVENALSDGHIEFPSEDDEYERINVAQTEAKRALKVMLSTQSTLIDSLYKKHEEYNRTYFGGKLSIPLITFERMPGRTLGSYTYGDNTVSVENHIRLNINFVALNTAERVHVELLHGMIHQWQDQVLYAKPQAAAGKIEVPVRNEKGKIVLVESEQKVRPKEWHNRDFKLMAMGICQIPCQGPNMSTGPAKMPEQQSYNRKFRCACQSTNGYVTTVWSTRPIQALCLICNQPFTEVTKDCWGGGVIASGASHIEDPDKDAIQEEMGRKYSTFRRFENKKKRDAFLAELVHIKPDLDYTSGLYQKGHNGRKMGFLYWLAYFEPITSGEEAASMVVEDAPATVPELPRGGKPKATKTSELVPHEGVSIAPPTAPSETATPPLVREYSADSPQDILDLYEELGTVKAVAQRLGKAQSSISDRIKKFGIDLNTKTFKLN